MKIHTTLPRWFTSLLIGVAVALPGAVLADGTEILGSPGIGIQDGTGIVAGGTGMFIQPGTIEVEVPDGATVEQVLLYWEGFMRDADPNGDDTIQIANDGATFTDVTGTLIGGPTHFFNNANASAFRADITGLALVGSGMNTLTVQGMDFTDRNNGAGVLVIFDDGSSSAGIDIRDGSDLAFINFAPTLDSTVLQTYNFAPSGADRIANLAMFFSSVAGSTTGGVQRPSTIEINVLGSTSPAQFLIQNTLDSIDGADWDTLVTAVGVPAGSTSITVQAFSRDDLGTGDLPASFDWIASALAFEPEDPPGVPGRMTGGGSVFRIDGARVTRGFEIHCDLREPNNLEVNWPGHRFHTTELTAAICTEDPAIDQLPRSAPFDTFNGTGIGRLNGVDGARIEFVFVDAGEPGRDDTASISIFDADNNLVLEVSGFMDRGNIQAHKDNQSTL